MATNDFSFESLMNSIKEINTRAGGMAKSAVNQLMTLRNWAIGYYFKGKRLYNEKALYEFNKGKS